MPALAWAKPPRAGKRSAAGPVGCGRWSWRSCSPTYQRRRRRTRDRGQSTRPPILTIRSKVLRCMDVASCVPAPAPCRRGSSLPERADSRPVPVGPFVPTAGNLHWYIAMAAAACMPEGGPMEMQTKQSGSGGERSPASNCPCRYLPASSTGRHAYHPGYFSSLYGRLHTSPCLRKSAAGGVGHFSSSG